MKNQFQRHLFTVSNMLLSFTKTKKFRLILLILATNSMFILGQRPSDLTSDISVTIQQNPPRLIFDWTPAKETSLQLMYRRLKFSSRWKQIARLDSGVSTFIDTVDIGINYEYQLRSLGTARAYDYISAGIEVKSDFLVNRDIVLLLIDSMLVDSLTDEIATLKHDMSKDGWIVDEMIVSRNQTSKEIKDSLINFYNLNNPFLQAIFILGHVPVPYSGNSAWDGHGNHQGAWPADVYYAVYNGTWTDSRVNNTSPSRAQNDNIPNDGKWDQDQIPGASVVAVGRVDFHNMPAFPYTEIELTRRYLDKLHKYKSLEIQSVNRALIDDNFGFFNGEAFSQSAWRNFNTFFIRDSIYSKTFEQLDYFTELDKRSYLWSYGCGGGNYRGANGIGSTFDFDTNQVQTIHTMLFGSYFGDWDVQNSFLRAPLASGTALTNCWAGRPTWFFHHMALGEHIGYSTRVSQNATSSQYQPVGFASKGTHVALMGDPTLRMYLFEGPSNLTINNLGNSSAFLEWMPSADPDILGYHVYRRRSNEVVYNRVTDMIETGTSIIDTVEFDLGEYVYLVRAVKLEVTITGSFYNLSPGAIGKVEITTNTVPSMTNNDIIISPNPVLNSFSLRGNSKLDKIESLQINDVNGQQVYSNRTYLKDQIVDISHIAGGTYFVIITDVSGNTSTIKLVKQ